MARSYFGVALFCATILILLLAGAHAADNKAPKAPKAPPAPKPPKPAPKPLKVKCLLKKFFPHCTQDIMCPHNCPRSCFVDCQRCAPVCVCYGPGGVCQDPRFVGGDGVTFYFHGKKDRDFCLLSDSDLHINAHFIGKTAPSRPRDFTWVQSIAVLFGDHRIYLGAEKTGEWDDSVDRLRIVYDGSPVELGNEEGTMWQSRSEGEGEEEEASSWTTIVRRTADANAVTVEVEGKLRITARVVPITEEESRVHNYGLSTEDDCFAHLELGFKFYSISNDVHGVLGQTYREGYVSKVKISAAMPVMGGDDQFSTTALYAPDCAVARFGKSDDDDKANGSAAAAASSSSLVSGLGAEVLCASGLAGSGIVCKK